jgi:hypothetical protein
MPQRQNVTRRRLAQLRPKRKIVKQSSPEAGPLKNRVVYNKSGGERYLEKGYQFKRPYEGRPTILKRVRKP